MGAVLLAFAMLCSAATGCSSSTENSTSAGSSDAAASSAKSAGSASDTITLVWYPNESAEDYQAARDEVGKLIEKATGKKVEQKLTTDYAIAIESLSNGTAQIGCCMGGEGYCQAKAANDAVNPLFVQSGESGTWMTHCTTASLPFVRQTLRTTRAAIPKFHAHRNFDGDGNRLSVRYVL